MRHYNSNNFLSKLVASRLVASRFLFFLFVFVATNAQASVDESFFYGNAVVKDPVIEMNSSFPPPNSPAVCGDSKPCLRAHQGLFNEIVTVIEEQDESVKVVCKNAVYGYHRDTQEKLNTFWAYKKDIALLQDLDSEVLQTIPHLKYAQEPTIVLVYPWKSFSVGTRFKRDPEHDTAIAYAVKVADFINNTAMIDFIPRKNALVETKKHPRAARKLFVKIINELIDRVEQSGQGHNNESHVIPYVWGGSSFVVPYTDFSFYSQDGSWNRDGKNDPYCGYDCSEFVMRMTQIAGIEFPWKTTSIIERSKRALVKNERLEEGDLIWMQGHVMIVGNVKRNEVIEARGYKSGYGCVHRFTVGECFEGVASYDELLKQYHLNKTIRLKDRQGIPVEKRHFFRLLKLID
ncbi:MAG: NlpC/P60 family protein [Candidatus Babeliales bacterium]